MPNENFYLKNYNEINKKNIYCYLTLWQRLENRLHVRAKEMTSQPFKYSKMRVSSSLGI